MKNLINSKIIGFLFRILSIFYTGRMYIIDTNFIFTILEINWELKLIY